MAFLVGTTVAATAEMIPLPRARPVDIAGDQSSTRTEAVVSPCQSRLAEVAAFKPLPPITGPGDCTATDVVELDAVRLSDKHRVVFSPTATLRCPMAEAVTHWVRDDVAPTIAALGKVLRSVETLDSFDCRRRNGIADAKISEHGHANALDDSNLQTVLPLSSLTPASPSRCARSYAKALVLVSRPCSVTAPMPIMIVTFISI